MRYVGPREPQQMHNSDCLYSCQVAGQAFGKSSSRSGTSPEVPSIRINIIMNDRGSLGGAVNWPWVENLRTLDRATFFPLFAQLTPMIGKMTCLQLLV